MPTISEHNRKVAINRWKRVFTQQMQTIRCNTTKFPNLKARILGYLMGDGSVTIRKQKNGTLHNSIYFYPDDLAMLNAFLTAFRTIYCLEPHIRIHPRYFRVYIDSQAAVQDLLSYGSFRSLEWVIPLSLLRTRKAKVEWLRAFYDAEAHVNKKVITVQSVNSKGLEQVKSLLEEFGIVSHLYSYKRKQHSWNVNFLLIIFRKEHRRTFLKEIGFNHSRKQQKLSAAIV